MSSARASDGVRRGQPRSRLLTGLSRDTVLLAVASFCSDISSEMLYPVLPIFLTQTLHATGSAVGVFYYGAFSAIAGSIALVALIPVRS